MGPQRTLAAILTVLLISATAGSAVVRPRAVSLEGAPTALATLHAALDRTRSSGGITRIVQFGDSHTAADQFTGALRRAFARDYGDAGPGLLYPIAPWAWYRRAGVVFDASAGWRIDGLGAGDGRYGVAGIAAHATRSGEYLRATASADRFEVMLLRAPGGGSVDILLDGRLESNHPLANRTPEAMVVRAKAATGAAHTIEVRTTADGPSRVLGIVAERGRAGVVYDALGINGAEADRALVWDRDAFTTTLAARAPDLVVVAYGTNEASSPDFEAGRYEACFAELLDLLRQAAPHASLLVLGPPDRCVAVRGEWRPLGQLAAVVAAQRRASLAAGAAFWDQRAAMGGPGSIDLWARADPPLAQSDRAHLTRAGYERVAGMLYAQLLRRNQTR